MSTQVREVAQRVKLNKLIARKSDGYVKRAEDYALRLNVDKTQVRGLANIAYTTDKISDITNWLKLRVGRAGSGKGWAKEGVGRDLIQALDKLRDDADDVVKSAQSTVDSGLSGQQTGPNADVDVVRQVHLQLCREFLKHLATHFEYREAGWKP
jgi:hypothetical protein